MNGIHKNARPPERSDRRMTFFLCGDVMTGRGIDQVLPHPCDPVLHESYVKDARDYVRLAEAANGPIPKPVHPSYIWGDALDELEKTSPDVKIVNLETSITTSDAFWPGKGINYRMHPENIGCITAAGIDACAMANNHVLDWGYPGLTETLTTLSRAGVAVAGAGRSRREAQRPAVIEVGDTARAIVLSIGSPTSGIPLRWAASEEAPGVWLEEHLSRGAIGRVREIVAGIKQKGDVVVASVHWGGNWGYDIFPEEIAFAHNLIDHAGVDIVHGHSSHHVKGIEVYKEKLILYGCGDFLNDYEGISGYAGFRGDLGLMYFAVADPLTGNLRQLCMIPTQVRRFRINRASEPDAQWLEGLLNREGSKFGCSVTRDADNRLTLRWDQENYDQ